MHKHRKISKKTKTPNLLVVDVKVDVEKVPEAKQQPELQRFH